MKLPLRKLVIDNAASAHEKLCVCFAKKAGAFALLARAANAKLTGPSAATP